MEATYLLALLDSACLYLGGRLASLQLCGGFELRGIIEFLGRWRDRVTKFGRWLDLKLPCGCQSIVIMNLVLFFWTEVLLCSKEHNLIFMLRLVFRMPLSLLGRFHITNHTFSHFPFLLVYLLARVQHRIQVTSFLVAPCFLDLDLFS